MRLTINGRTQMWRISAGWTRWTTILIMHNNAVNQPHRCFVSTFHKQFLIHISICPFICICTIQGFDKTWGSPSKIWVLLFNSQSNFKTQDAENGRFFPFHLIILRQLDNQLLRRCNSMDKPIKCLISHSTMITWCVSGVTEACFSTKAGTRAHDSRAHSRHYTSLWCSTIQTDAPPT